MKMHHIFLIAVLATLTICGDTLAQERLFGNGRFLRRLRNDITGNKTPDPKTAKKTTKSTKAPTKATSKKPTKAPTPASNGMPTRVDAFYGTSNKSNRKEFGSGTASRQTAPRKVLAESKFTSNAQRSSKKATIGFGMLVEVVKDKFVVTDIDRRGNAAQKDIKKGDLVISAGGVKLSTLNDFNDITDILRDGDQIEMEFSRHGKESKKIVQMGEMPEPPATASQDSPSKTDGKIESLTEVGSGLQSVLGTKTRPANHDVIRRQSEQIEAMQRELERLRRAQSNASSTGGSVLEGGPDLSGPGL